MMPLSEKPYVFPDLALESFHGLPGLLSNSLPDKFGTTVTNAWLMQNGYAPDAVNAVERLRWLGNRGMGALEFFPSTKEPRPEPRWVDRILQVETLVRFSNAILAWRPPPVSQKPGDPSMEADILDADAMADMLRVCTSAGGARAKAIIAWNPKTHEIRSGPAPVEQGFEDWLIKFDGITQNRDKETADAKGYGVVEFAYYRMAIECGIFMSECRLLEEGGRRHFMTRRFDRLAGGEKLHLQSLAALAHLDFNRAGVYRYEDVFDILDRLEAPRSDAVQLFRRIVFNIIARNQDDHVKNMAFLMDRSGNWSLSPAYDLTFAYHPGGNWTDRHQMTLSGKRDRFTLEDLVVCGKRAGLNRETSKKIVAEIRQVVAGWPGYAEDLCVFPHQRDRIQKGLRLDIC